MNRGHRPPIVQDKIIAALLSAPDGLTVADLYGDLETGLKSLNKAVQRLRLAGRILQRIDEHAIGKPAHYWHPEHGARWEAWVSPLAPKAVLAKAGNIVPCRQPPPMTPVRHTTRMIDGRAVPVTICPRPASQWGGL